MKQFSLSLWILILPILAWGQVSIPIHLVDHETGVSLPGANVTSITSKKNFRTDANGRLILKAEGRYSFRFVGYKTLEMELVANDSLSEKTPLRVKLTSEIVQTTAVLVTAERIDYSNSGTRPISITQVKRAEMDKSGNASVVDLLRGQAGVFVQQTTPLQGSVYVRGRAGRDVLYLFNDLRVNPAFVRSGQNQYFGVFDAFGVEEMKVFKGPVSVYYGSDALSGGIDVEMPGLTYTPKFAADGFYLAQANAGGSGELSTAGRFGFSTNRVSFYAGGSIREFTTYNMPEGTDPSLWFPYDRKLENADFSFRSGYANLGFRLFRNTKLSFLGYWSLVPDGPRFDQMTMGYSYLYSPQPTFPAEGYFSNTAPMGFSAFQTSLSIPTANKYFASIDLRAGYHYLRDHRITRDFDKTPVFGTGDNVFSISDNFEEDLNRNAQQLAALDITSLVGENLTVRWGADYVFDYVGSKRSQWFFDNPNYREERRLSRYPNKSKMKTLAGFAHADYQFSDKLSFETGIRATRQNVDIPFEGVFDPAGRGLDPLTQTYYSLTGNFASDYRLSSENITFIQIGTGFRAPNVADLAELGPRRSRQYNTPNADLKPEKTINFETGIRRTTSVYTISGSAFLLRYVDKINLEQTGRIVDFQGNPVENTGDPIPGQFREFTPENSGKQYIAGIELEANAVWNSFIESGFRFTFMDGRLVSNGEREIIDRLPPANGMAFVSYKPLKWLVLRPETRFNFNRFDIADEEFLDVRINPLGTDGFVIAHLNVEFVAAKTFTFRMRAENLFNQVYRDYGSSLDGLQRNVTFTAKYSF